MASIYDIETRATSLARKYAAYDEDVEKAKKERPADAFEELYQQLEDLVDALTQKAEAVHSEKNRAVVAQTNAEIRRGKAQLRTDLGRLHKLAKKRSRAPSKPSQSTIQGAAATSNPMCSAVEGGSKQNHKGLAPEELEDRYQRLAELSQRMEAIADGVHMQAPDRKGKAPLNPMQIRFETVSEEAGGAGKDASYFEQTEHSRQFRSEFELVKQRQDKDLDEISRGVGKLRDLAGEMGEEMSKQDDLIDTIETKVDENNADIRTVNSKLRQALTSIRSSRNFCMDVTLICIVLSIGAYIYSIFA